MTHSLNTHHGWQLRNHRNEDNMTELEALRHQIKMLEAQLIEQREQSYRANLRDVELHQAAQADPGKVS